MDDGFVGLRQRLRKVVKHMVVKYGPIRKERLLTACARLDKIKDIGQDTQEVEQAITILIGQQEIAEYDGQLMAPGTMPKKPKHRSLDSEWDV